MDFKMGLGGNMHPGQESSANELVAISKVENGFIIDYTPKVSLEDNIKSKLNMFKKIKDDLGGEEEREGDEWKKLLKDQGITTSSDSVKELPKAKTYIASTKEELLDILKEIL